MLHLTKNFDFKNRDPDRLKIVSEDSQVWMYLKCLDDVSSSLKDPVHFKGSVKVKHILRIKPRKNKLVQCRIYFSSQCDWYRHSHLNNLAVFVNSKTVSRLFIFFIFIFIFIFFQKCPTVVIVICLSLNIYWFALQFKLHTSPLYRCFIGNWTQVFKYTWAALEARIKAWKFLNRMWDKSKPERSRNKHIRNKKFGLVIIFNASQVTVSQYMPP